MFGNVYGLDLGTYEIKVYDKKQNAIWKEKNAVAITKDKKIFSVGDTAYEMFEKSPINIEIVFPMKEGVISRFYDMQYLLQNLLKKEHRFASGSKYIIAVPTDVTEVEKRAFYDLVVHSTAKAKEVRIVERGIADAIGLGLDVQNATGIFVANLGGETTELSVLSHGGVVLNKLIKFGGKTLDQSVASAVRTSKDFLIGRITAEALRKQFGVLAEEEMHMRAAGRNLLLGVPELQEVSSKLVQPVIKEQLLTCIGEIKFLLERTPPEVLRAIQKDGIYITGGLANLKGLPAHMEQELGLKVHTVKEPEICAVNGLKQIIQSKELKKNTYSMLDENYRWMR